MTPEERITDLERRFKKELAELKAVLSIQGHAAYKKGDFCFSDNGMAEMIFIYGSTKSIIRINCLAVYMVEDDGLYIKSDWIDIEKEGVPNIRLATESEKQILLDKLHEAGKAWDAEKCEIVDYRWAPKPGETYFTPFPFSEAMFMECAYKKSLPGISLIVKRLIERNLVYKTPEEAIKVAQGWLDSLK